MNEDTFTVVPLAGAVMTGGDAMVLTMKLKGVEAGLSIGPRGLVSTALTLYVVPCVYSLFTRFEGHEKEDEA